MHELFREIANANQHNGMLDHLVETRIISRIWRGTNRSVDTLEDLLKDPSIESDHQQIRELITLIDGAGNSPQHVRAEPMYQWTGHSIST